MEPYSFDKRVENLIKSYFAENKNVGYNIDAEKIHIHLIEVNNVDCASLDVQKINGCFKIYFWDGYSQSEVIEVNSEKDAAKTINCLLYTSPSPRDS